MEETAAHAPPLPKRFGKRIERPKRVDTAMTNAVMDQLATFCLRVFTCSPIRGLSFNSNKRKTRQAGSKVTATTCTKMVIASCTAVLATSDTTPEETSINK